MDAEAAHALTRVQIAMWLPAKCAACGKPYANVDDFLERNPVAGPGFGTPWIHETAFIDSACREATHA